MPEERHDLPGRAHARSRAGGRTIARFQTQLAQLVVVDRRDPIAGRTVIRATARGKHLIVELSGDLFLRTHMRMHGSWHLYRPGERWRAPKRDARIVLTTSEWIAIAFAVSDAELVTGEALERHARLARGICRHAWTSTRGVACRRRPATS
jgi:endonuclease-8